MFNISDHLVISPPAREFMVLIYLNFPKDCIPVFFSNAVGDAERSLFFVSISRNKKKKNVWIWAAPPLPSISLYHCNILRLHIHYIFYRWHDRKSNVRAPGSKLLKTD